MGGCGRGHDLHPFGVRDDGSRVVAEEGGALVFLPAIRQKTLDKGHIREGGGGGSHCNACDKSMTVDLLSHPKNDDGRD